MIRPLEAADRGGVRELLQATGNFTAAELDIADELVATVLDDPGQRDYHAFVAPAAEGRGPGGLTIVGPTPGTMGTWDLYWLAVHPAGLGTGMAQELATFAEAFVRQSGGYLLIAETSSQAGYARARAFYRKRGYGELARIADYYRPGDDLLIFGKRV